MFFDAHSDIWCDVTAKRLAGETNVLKNHHLDRLRKGGVEGSIFVIWVDPPYDNDHYARTMDIMKCVKDEVAECDDIRIVHSYDEMIQAKKDGKIYVFHGVEGMAAAKGDLAMIDRYYDFGCRHGIITWNEENEFGAGALSGSDKGLTDLGKKAVKKIQDKNMLLDVSHLNDAGFWDIARIATKPIVASHSNCRALCEVPRNLTDDQLRAIRDLDGVVGVNSFNIFVDSDVQKQDVAHLARHVAHIADLIGVEHVGCGFDFFEFCSQDSMDSMDVHDDFDTPAVHGMRDSSEIPNLFKELKKLGMTEEELKKIAYENFQNIIKKAVG